MIDIKQIRENPERYKKAALDKRIDADVDRLIEVARQISQAKKQLQEIATDKNKIGKSIPKLADGEKAAALAQLADLKKRESQYNGEIQDLGPLFEDLMLQVPQPADADVPLGRDDTENIEIRTEGDIPTFDFDVTDHLQLDGDFDIIDVDRAVTLRWTRN